MSYVKRTNLRILIDAIKISRPWSFLMTITSVSLSTAYVYYEKGIFDLLIYLLVLLGAVLIHAFINVSNDYFDTLYKIDIPGAPTTRYRPHPIVAGLFTPRQTFAISLGYITLALILALIFLFFLERPWIILIAAIGALISFEYTAPPLRYKYKGIGELVVFIGWGPLMFIGAYYAQTGIIPSTSILVSIPIGLYVASVLLIDGIRDYEYDKSSNIKTLPILLGRNTALKLYFSITTIPFVAVVLLILFNLLPITSLIVFLSLPRLINLMRIFSKEVPDIAAPLTAQFTLFYGILLIAGIILGALI